MIFKSFNERTKHYKNQKTCSGCIADKITENTIYCPKDQRKIKFALCIARRRILLLLNRKQTNA